MTALDRLASLTILHTLETLERSGERVILAALAFLACAVMVAAFVWAWAKGRK
jgi:hypothetical protein